MIAGDSTPYGPNRVEVAGVVVVVEVAGVVVDVVADAIAGVLISTRVMQLVTREIRRCRAIGTMNGLFRWRPHDLCNQLASP
jgi:hypothetical protein